MRTAVGQVPEVYIVCAEVLEGLEGGGDFPQVCWGSGERRAFED